MKAAIDNMYTKAHGCVPTFLQKVVTDPWLKFIDHYTKAEFDRQRQTPLRIKAKSISNQQTP